MSRATPRSVLWHCFAIDVFPVGPVSLQCPHLAYATILGRSDCQNLHELGLGSHEFSGLHVINDAWLAASRNRPQHGTQGFLARRQCAIGEDGSLPHLLDMAGHASADTTRRMRAVCALSSICKTWVSISMKWLICWPWTTGAIARRPSN